MTTPAQVPIATEEALRHVGIWGATASGKSTFLSALFTAAMRSPDEVRVRGDNDESTDFLTTNTHILNTQHQFPPPTEAHQPLSWTLQMWVPNRAPRRLLQRPGPATVPFDFRVDLRDAPGREFAAVPNAVPSRIDVGSGNGDPNIASYLGTCQGLLLLIDPIRERERGDANEYFYGTLLRMAQELPVPLGQRLPHYVAVCLTKFDDPTVYTFARDRGYLAYLPGDPVMLPRIHPDNSKRFMRELFDDQPEDQQMSDIDLVFGALERYFYPERIRYFVTSAVGFYVGKSNQFREDDYNNVAPVEGGKYMIRGAVRPVNVAEPLLWLGRCIAAEG